MRLSAAIAAVVIAAAALPAFAQEPADEAAPVEQLPPVDAPTVYAPPTYAPPTVYAPTVYAPTVYAPPVYAPPQQYAPPLVIVGQGPGYLVAAPPCPPGVELPGRKAMLKVSLGFHTRYALGENFSSGAGEWQLGAEKNGFGGAVRFAVQVGRTDHGLTFEWYEFGPAFEWALGERWRLGFGITHGILSLERNVHAPGPNMLAGTWGGYLETSADLVKARGGHALYAVLRVGWDHMFNVTDLPAESVQGSLALGYRY